MSEDPEKVADFRGELSAIEAMISALEGLHKEARVRALRYVLSIFRADDLIGEAADPGSLSRPATSAEKGTDSREQTALDIRSLREAKSPRSAIEMAVLVAYYLSEVCPEEERLPSISRQELEAYFKQAGYPIPAKPRNVLFQATKAGYMVAVERGRYRLTPVGYNLVVHRLPSETSASRRRLKNRRQHRTPKTLSGSSTLADRTPAAPERL
jgi:hypothetical protein